MIASAVSCRVLTVWRHLPVDDFAGNLPGVPLGVRTRSLLPLIEEQLAPLFGNGACQVDAAPLGFFFPDIGQIAAPLDHQFSQVRDGTQNIRNVALEPCSGPVVMGAIPDQSASPANSARPVFRPRIDSEK